MTKRTRFILFVFFLALYLILAPILIFYSLGYRFDFKNNKVFTTGGFYFRIWPVQTQVTVGDKIKQSTGMFSNEMLIQGLSAGKYNVSVSKDGYFPWQKNLNVENEQVTSIPNVTLVKQKISFQKINPSTSSGQTNNINDFSFSPDNAEILLASATKNGTDFSVINSQEKTEIGSAVLPISQYSLKWSDDSSKILISGPKSQYYIFDYTRTKENMIKSFDFAKKNISDVSLDPQNPGELLYIQNGWLYGTAKKSTPIIKDLLAYKVYGKTIYWLSDSGSVYSSGFPPDDSNVPLNSATFPVKDGSSYKIFVLQNLTFLEEDKNLFLLDPGTKTFENFYDPVNDMKISPDGSKIVYSNEHEIFYSDSDTASERIFLQRFSGKITDCFWMNNGYLVLDVSGTIKISEIDNRDKVNVIDLPGNISLTDNTLFQLKNPKIFFDVFNKNLYILDQNSLFESEQLTDKKNY